MHEGAHATWLFSAWPPNPLLRMYDRIYVPEWPPYLADSSGVQIAKAHASGKAKYCFNDPGETI